MKSIFSLILLCLTCASWAQNPEADLVAHWSFDGSFEDSLQQLPLNNAGAVTFGPGRNGQAAHFNDHYESFLTTPAINDVMNGLTDRVTITMWFKPDGENLWTRLISYIKDDGAGDFLDWNVVLGEGSLLEGAIFGPNNAVHGSGPNISDTEWTHLAVAYEQGVGNLEIFINGEPVMGLSQDGFGPYDAALPWTIGAYAIPNDPADASGDHFYGFIDDLRVYSNVLSPEDIQVLASEPAGSNAGENGLVAHWGFDGTLTDQQNQRLLNNSGGVTFETGRSGQAARFNGEPNSVLTSPPVQDILGASGQTTVAMWIKPDADNGWARLIDHLGGEPYGDEPGWSLVVAGEESNTYRVLAEVMSPYHGADGVGPIQQTDEWLHVAVTYIEGVGDMNIYVNGEHYTFVSLEGFSAFDQMRSWTVGGHLPHDHPVDDAWDVFKGLIDDLRVYNRVVSEELILQLASEPPVAVGDQGLVAHWSFDETLNDELQQQPLTNGGGVTFDSGRSGHAVRFSGALDSFLITPTVNEMLAGQTNKVSVAFWMKPDADNEWARLISHREGHAPSDAPGWNFSLRKVYGSTNLETFGEIFGPTDFAEASGPQFDGGEWMHVAVVYEVGVGEMKVYIDGQLEFSMPHEHFAPYDGDAAWSLGAYLSSMWPNDEPFDLYKGLMDDLRVYNTTLSQDVITQLASKGPTSAAHTDMYVDYVGETAGATHTLGVFYTDIDTNGDGFPDFAQTGENDDLDGDGLANKDDDDDDGDGIPDVEDTAGHYSNSGWAPALEESMPASSFAYGEQAAANGLHPGDYWQFVPNGTFDQTGQPYTNGNGEMWPDIFQNPGAYLYVDRFDAQGNPSGDQIPDILQPRYMSNKLAPYLLEKDYVTETVDGVPFPGLLGLWDGKESGQTVFEMCDDDSGTYNTNNYLNFSPYQSAGQPRTLDIFSSPDAQPDYLIYGTEDEADPAIPEALKTLDSRGVPLWRYRKSIGPVSNERELEFFLTTYWMSGGSSVNTYFSRSDFNEVGGSYPYRRNSATTGDGFGFTDAESRRNGRQNWFPEFQHHSDHNRVADDVLGYRHWTDVADEPVNGDAPVALDPANQPWVDMFQNYQADTKIVNYINVEEGLATRFGPVDVFGLLLDRYNVDLSLNDTNRIVRLRDGRMCHTLVTPLEANGQQFYLMGWEDIFGGGDRDYDDVFFFTNRKAGK